VPLSGGVPLFPPLMVPGDGASVPDRVSQGVSPPQLAILFVLGVLTVISFVAVLVVNLEEILSFFQYFVV
jgi:hypothetical protein